SALYHASPRRHHGPPTLAARARLPVTRASGFLTSILALLQCRPRSTVSARSLRNVSASCQEAIEQSGARWLDPRSRVVDATGPTTTPDCARRHPFLPAPPGNPLLRARLESIRGHRRVHRRDRPEGAELLRREDRPRRRREELSRLAGPSRPASHL